MWDNFFPSPPSALQGGEHDSASLLYHMQQRYPPIFQVSR